MYLLDTIVVSALRRAGSGHAHPAVTRWASTMDPTLLHLSAVTLMEIEIGILRLARRDGAQAERLRSWLERQVIPAFARRILSVDLAVALRCAKLVVPNPKADRDALIAATAQVYGLTVVTRNTADFEATGVALLNPWSEAT